MFARIMPTRLRADRRAARARAACMAALFSTAWLAPCALHAQAPTSTRLTTTERFEFHSDPWINLHHFLYHWARESRGLGDGRQHVSVAERSSPAMLAPAERAAWDSAVEFYRTAVAERSHFQPRMLELKRALLELHGDVRRMPPDTIPGIALALRQAMPVYLAHWWPAHDSANRAWVATVAPLLARHEVRFVELTRRLYGATWPAARFRVDVSAYANARAGYTEPRDGHIVIYSTDAGNQGLYGLETLLHEIEHASTIGAPGRTALEHAFERAGVAMPDNLWHGVIFGTAGAFVQTVAEREGLPGHEPYWLREGFGSLRGWAPVVRAVTAEWTPVVRRGRAPGEALDALVRRMRSPT
jgi:hypothetical protein